MVEYAATPAEAALKLLASPPHPGAALDALLHQLPGCSWSSLGLSRTPSAFEGQTYRLGVAVPEATKREHALLRSYRPSGDVHAPQLALQRLPESPVPRRPMANILLQL